MTEPMAAYPCGCQTWGPGGLWTPCNLHHAAPDLLAAVELVYSWINEDSHEAQYEVVGVLADAISKAKYPAAAKAEGR